MRDPHIQTVHYAVGSGEGISYSNPESISFANHLGTFNLSKGKLEITPTEHFPDEDAARQAVEPFLRAWEMEADLTSNVGMIRFEFDRADVIDRDPLPPGSPQVLHVKGASSVSVAGSVTVHVTRSKYPKPPMHFRATPEVEHAYRRWLGYQAGKEPLQSMAYFVLTILEKHAAGSRKDAARSFLIDLPILSKIGELSSTKGDASTARKAGDGNQFQELSGAEKNWLENAVRRVICRLGEHASGGSLPLISARNLPDL